MLDADGDTCSDDMGLATGATAVALDDAARLTVERFLATAFGTCIAAATGCAGVLGPPDAGLVQKSAKKSASATRGKRRVEASDDDNGITDADAGADDNGASVEGGIEGNGASAGDATSCAQNESKNSDASCRLARSAVAAARGGDTARETRVKDGCDGDEDCTETAAATGSDSAIEGGGRAIDAVSGAQNESKNKSSTRRAVRRAAAAARGFNTALATGAADDDDEDAEEFERVEGEGAALV